MKILIINPPIRLSDKPRHIPHGLAILANMIQKKIKCDLTFLDWNANRWTEEQFINIIKKQSWDFVLMGGLIPTYKYLITIADIVKKIHPKARVVAGGSAAMSVPETLLENSKVDILCTGEGEETLLELISAFQQEDFPDLSKILGIAYKDADSQVVVNHPRSLIENLDEESYLPAYDILPMDIYLSNPVVGMGRDIDFISGRGCPFKCSFCYQPWGQKNRRHSAEFLKESILYLKKKYNIDYVSFQDDLFIADKERLYEFCELRNKFFPDIYWSCTGRANICDDEMVRTIRESGCTVVSYGFESASPKMLKSMKKKINIHQMENVIQLNRKYGLPVPVSFILGMPGEDEETCQDTIEFCKRNNLTLNSLMFATPYPGTELFDFAVKTGRIQKDKIHDFIIKLGDARDFVINLTDSFTDGELIEKYKYMIDETNKSYAPIAYEEMEKKIKDLYGPLSEHYLNMPYEERKHKASHGGINMF